MWRFVWYRTRCLASGYMSVLFDCSSAALFADVEYCNTVQHELGIEPYDSTTAFLFLIVLQHNPD